MQEESRALLADARRTVADAEAEISQAVYALEHDGGVEVAALLGEAMNRLKILDQRIARAPGRPSRRNPTVTRRRVHAWAPRFGRLAAPDGGAESRAARAGPGPVDAGCLHGPDHPTAATGPLQGHSRQSGCRWVACPLRSSRSVPPRLLSMRTVVTTRSALLAAT